MMFLYTYNVFRSYSYYCLFTHPSTPAGSFLFPSSLSSTIISVFVIYKSQWCCLQKHAPCPPPAISNCL